MSEEKYIYGISNEDNGILVSIAKKDDWVRRGIYDCNYSEDLNRLMDYLGYDNEYFNLGFINNFEIRPKLSIINYLNKHQLLEFNEDFENFMLTHVYSFTTDKTLDVCTICVTPNIYWKKRHKLCPKKTNPIISNFLISLGLRESIKGVFEFNGQVKAPYILTKINKMKYLQHDNEFQAFIDDENE